MAVRYNKLFKLMIDKKVTNAELIQKAGFSANIMTRLKKDKWIASGRVGAEPVIAVIP